MEEIDKPMDQQEVAKIIEDVREDYIYDPTLAYKVRIHYKKAPLKITANKFNLTEAYTYYLVTEFKKRRREEYVKQRN